MSTPSVSPAFEPRTIAPAADPLAALAMDERRVHIAQEADKWDLCCSRTSGSLIRFASQLAVCAAVLGFSFYSIARSPEANNSIYYSLISGIVGYVLPAPRINETPH